MQSSRTSAVFTINPICKYQIQVCTCHVSNSVCGISLFLTNRFKLLESKKRYRCKKGRQGFTFSLNASSSASVIFHGVSRFNFSAVVISLQLSWRRYGSIISSKNFQLKQELQRRPCCRVWTHYLISQTLFMVGTGDYNCSWKPAKFVIILGHILLQVIAVPLQYVGIIWG